MKPLRITKLDIASLLIIALIGLIHLPFPYMGDQVIFNQGAIEMRAGEFLYRDFWDLKLPGIFVFFGAAGRLFGFNEVGAHLLEIIWNLAFCIYAMTTLRPHFRSSVGPALLPLLTIGLYYGSAGVWHLTQTEILTALPIFLSFHMVQIASRSRGRRRALALIASGVGGGIVLVTKLLIMPIVGAFWIAWLAHEVFVRRRSPLRSLGQVILWPLVGMAIPCAAVLAYVLPRGLLDDIMWTAFVYPTKVAAMLSPQTVNQLVDGMRWYLGWFGPSCSLALIGAVVLWRRDRRFLAMNLALWVGAAFVIVLAQRQAWSWQYHYLLLIAPVGILSAFAIDEIWVRLGEARSDRASLGRAAVGLAVLAVFYSSFALGLAGKVSALARSGFALSVEDRSQYQQRMNGDYAMALRETAFLGEPDAAPGDIFVWGNPLLNFLSGRKQAIAYNGWLLNLTLDEQWISFSAELREKKPPYIFIESFYRKFINEGDVGGGGEPGIKRGQAFAQVLEDLYRPHHSSDDGIWYALARREPDQESATD